MNQLLSFPAALDLVLHHARTLPAPPTELLTLPEALGRILAEPILADRDQPPFDRSTRDGFALLASPSLTRAVIGQLRAGDLWSGPALTPHTAVEIMTGAPVPPGADAVVMIEHTTLSNNTLAISPQHIPSPGQNLVKKGAELPSGATALAPGTRLGPAEIAIAASLGKSPILVFRQPQVSILATGDELVDLGEVPSLQQIRNSNSFALAALVAQTGALPTRLPIARDTLQSLHDALDRALESDLLLLSGGVSAGKFDLVETALAARNSRVFFTGVRMQPGKPVVFGALPRTGRPDLPFFGLPGNPISTEVTFTCLAAPLLRALGGASDLLPRLALARLAEPVAANPNLTRILPAHLAATFADPATVRLTPWQGSGDLAANARSNCFAVLPNQPQPFRPGDLLTVLLR